MLSSRTFCPAEDAVVTGGARAHFSHDGMSSGIVPGLDVFHPILLAATTTYAGRDVDDCPDPGMVRFIA